MGREKGQDLEDLGCVAGSSTEGAEEVVQVRLLDFVFLLGFQPPAATPIR